MLHEYTCYSVTVRTIRHFKMEMTHRVGIAELVGNPLERSPNIVVGVEYPLGFVIVEVTMA